MDIANALWNMPMLLFWYAAGVIWSLTNATMQLKDGIVAWWELAFGVSAVGSALLGGWLAVRNRSWTQAWIVLPLAVSFGFVFISSLLAAPDIGPGTQPMAPEKIRLVAMIAAAAEGLALVVLFLRMRPNWGTASAFAVYCITFWLAALWQSNGTLTHMYL